jgi:Domain of unknown function (DUF4410)
MNNTRQFRFALRSLVLLALLALPSLAAQSPSSFDDGKLDPTWFGEGVTFRELDEVDYFWVAGDFELAGKSVFFAPWGEPEFLGPKAADRDAKDHELAKRMNNDMADLLRQAFAETYGNRLTMALGDEADVRVEGRIVDTSTGSTAAKVFVGFGAGSGNVTIDLRFVDSKTGVVLAGLHHRVVSGSVYSTSNSKFEGWVEDLAEDLAKKGFAKLYAKGDRVDD